MTFLEKVNKVADALTKLAHEDPVKRAYILVAIDEEKVKDNTLLAVTGKAKGVQLLLESLLKEEELSSTMVRAMIRTMAKTEEHDINDLLNELK